MDTFIIKKMKEIEIAIKSYLDARNNLIRIGLKFPKLISGNDNMIGRIGEYLAIKFLEEEMNQHPEKVLEKNNKGYDLIDKEDSGLTTQVKMITNENNNGTTVRLEPWKQFVLIDLNLESLDSKIGFITYNNFISITKKMSWSENPVISRRMLGEKG